MTLIDERPRQPRSTPDRRRQWRSPVDRPPTRSSGVAALGGRAEYLGKVRDDQLGAVFAHDIRATGVHLRRGTGARRSLDRCCLILVTPDAQRTMNTYLGASVNLGPGDVDRSRSQRASVLYLEGYLFDRPEAQEAFRVAADYAHDAGRIVSAHPLGQLLRRTSPWRPSPTSSRDHVDLLFANEDEILSLYETDVLRRRPRSRARPRRGRGAHPFREGFGRRDRRRGRSRCPPSRSTSVGGHHRCRRPLRRRVPLRLQPGMDPADCGHLGSLAAAEVISHLGARPEADLAALAADCWLIRSGRHALAAAVRVLLRVESRRSIGRVGQIVGRRAARSSAQPTTMHTGPATHTGQHTPHRPCVAGQSEVDDRVDDRHVPQIDRQRPCRHPVHGQRANRATAGRVRSWAQAHGEGQPEDPSNSAPRAASGTTDIDGT